MNQTELMIALGAALIAAFLLGWLAGWLTHRAGGAAGSVDFCLRSSTGWESVGRSAPLLRPSTGASLCRAAARAARAGICPWSWAGLRPGCFILCYRDTLLLGQPKSLLYCSIATKLA